MTLDLISSSLQPLIAPNDGLTLRSGQEDDYRRDSIERDEKRLAELGRKTVEMFAIGYIITERMEVSCVILCDQPHHDSSLSFCTGGVSGCRGSQTPGPADR
jgi:hypothetical protein